eukprot:6055952-Amphidinium_carterae.1
MSPAELDKVMKSLDGTGRQRIGYKDRSADAGGLWVAHSLAAAESSKRAHTHAHAHTSTRANRHTRTGHLMLDLSG